MGGVFGKKKSKQPKVKAAEEPAEPANSKAGSTAAAPEPAEEPATKADRGSSKKGGKKSKGSAQDGGDGNKKRPADEEDEDDAVDVADAIVNAQKKVRRFLVVELYSCFAFESHDIFPRLSPKWPSFLFLCLDRRFCAPIGMFIGIFIDVRSFLCRIYSSDRSNVKICVLDPIRGSPCHPL